MWNVRGVLVIGLLAGVLTACGGEEDPAGPDVTGWTLPEAKRALKKAGVNPQIESDALFGVVVEENFTVCEVHPLNAKAVRLTVDNDGCQ